MRFTPLENGSKKAKSSGSGGLGVWNRMLMPRFMKGVVKSTAFSRSAVIVRSVMAKWISCNAIYLDILNLFTIRALIGQHLGR